jgi:hypothetical protein
MPAYNLSLCGIYLLLSFCFVLNSTSLSDGFNVEEHYSSVIVMDLEYAAFVIWRYVARNAANLQPILTETIHILLKIPVQAGHIGSTAYGNSTAAVNYDHHHHHHQYSAFENSLCTYKMC